MENLCNYCGCCPVATDLGWTYTCQSCTYICNTCYGITPYESGQSENDDCDTCWATKQKDSETAQTPETEQTITDEFTGNKKVVSIVVFDEATRSYTVAETKIATELPQDLLTLLDNTADVDDEVKTDIIGYEMMQTVSLLNSQQRAKETRMTRADHSPVVMRTGEWNSLLLGLQVLAQDKESVNPRYRIANAVDYQVLIDILQSQVAKDVLEQVVL